MPERKKADKPKSRESQYRSIAEKAGTRLEDCRVLSFVFEFRTGTVMFHFDLMVRKLGYIFFDSWGKYANVVISKDDRNADAIIALAAQNGGQKTMIGL